MPGFLLGPVLNASLNLRATQMGYTFCLQKEFDGLLKKYPTWMAPSAHIKVRMHIYLLCGVILLLFRPF